MRDVSITEHRLRVLGLAWMILLWMSYAKVMWTPSIVELGGKIKGRDFPQFYTMGAFVRDGRADLLQDGTAMTEWLRTHVPEASGYRLHAPVYGPQVAAFFAPLSRLSYGNALGVWILMTFALYGVSCWLLTRNSASLRAGIGTVAIYLAGSPALLLAVVYGHLSSVALFCAAVAYVALRNGRTLVAGFALGLLGYKPQLGLVFGAVFCLWPDWRVLSGAAGALLIQVAVALTVAPLPVSVAYVRRLLSLASDPSPVQSGNLALNESLSGFFNLLIGSGPWATIAYLLSAAAVLVFSLIVWRSKTRLELRFSTLVIATVLVSPHFFVYDLLVLVVPMLLLLGCALEVGPGSGARTMWAVVAVLYLIAPLGLAVSLAIRVAAAPVALLAVFVYLVKLSLGGQLQMTESGSCPARAVSGGGAGEAK